MHQSTRATRWLFRAVLGGISLIAVLYLVKASAGVDLSQFVDRAEQMNWPMAVLALLIGLGHVVAGSRMIQLLLPRAERAGMLSVLLMAQIAKYVPGRIWGVVMQKALASPTIGVVRLVSANAVGMALVVYAQASVFLAALVWKWAGSLLAVVTLLLLALSLYATSSFFIRWAAKRRRFEWLSHPEPHWCRLLAVSWFATAITLFGAWAVLLGGAFGLELGLMLDGVVLATASFVAGLASLLPAGLGVREGAFVWLGNNVTVETTGVVLGLAVATRIYLLALDTIAATAGFGLHMLQRFSR